jgi:3-hydroxybutyrate dehydrogenase
MSALSGKWALVTGATAGLGFAIAEGLAGAGANLIVHDLAAPREAAESLNARFGVEAISIAADLSQRAAIESMMGDLLARLDGIDILVNNAVVRYFAPVEDFSPEQWEQALAVNLSAPFHLTRLALPAMKRRGFGRIINLGSIYSTRAVVERIDYVTTKTAIVGMTRAIAIETAQTNITCNALCPGTLPTPAIQSRIEAGAARDGRAIEEATREFLAARQPSGRFVATEGVAALAVFLCTPAARDITGAALPIDGGWSVS